MLLYVVLISFPAVTYICNHRYAFTVSINETKHRIRSINCITVFFVILFLMLALRSISCGRDLRGYYNYFVRWRNLKFSVLMNEQEIVESGYKLLNWVIGRLTSNFQWLLAVIAFICIYPLMWFYSRESNMPYLTIILFCTVAPFSLYFSGIRQAIALSFTVPTLIFAKKRKLIPYIICVLFATTFHLSAYILFVIYPVYNLKINNKWLLIFVPVFILLYIFRRQIFEVAFSFLPDIYQLRYEQTTNTGAYGMLSLLVLFSIYVWVVPGKAVSADINGLRNLLMVATAIQCFALIHVIAMRYNYYFLLTLPILIPKVIEVATPKFKKIANVSIWVMSIFFTFYFFYVLVAENDLDIYPYLFFWQK